MSSTNPFLTPKKKSRDNPFLQDDSLVDLFDPLPELRRDKAARGDKDPEGDMSAYQQAIYGLESGVINIANSYDASRINSLRKQKRQLIDEGRLEIGKRQVGGEHGYEEPVYLTFESEQIPGMIEHIDTKLKGYAKSLSNNLMIQSGIPRSAVMQEIAEAETFSEAWNSFLKDPLGVMATVTAESFPIMAPALIVAPFNPLLGAVVMGLSSGGIEYGGELLEALAKTGITQEDLIAASQNEALMAEAEQHGMDRGLIIGTIDALSAGLARKMLIPSKLVGSRVGREALNIPAQIVAQMVAGGGGEAAAQLEKSGEITDPGHVFLETVGEGALAPVEVLAFAQKRKAADRAGAERPPPSDDLDQVLGVETPEAAPEDIAQPAAPTETEHPFMEPAKPAKPLRTAKQAEAGAKTIADRPQGAEKVSFAGDRQVNTRYALVEREDLVASHTKEGKKNLNYPQRLQPRDRSRAASQAWAAEKAGRFQPELITEGPSLAEGAPTITQDGVVVSGNGRKILMDAIYRRDSGKADEYKAYLRENAENFGLTAEDIDSLKEPILVRVLTDEISDQDLIALAQAANVTETAKLSPVEQAKVDAGNLTENDLALLEPDQSGNLLAKTNDKFVKVFMAKLTAAEIGNLVSKDGQPLKPLVDRMQAAIFAKAYADDRVLELMAEVANPTLKNIITAMAAAAPAFARARAHGDLGNLNIVDPLLEGMGLLMAARQANQTIEQFLDQGALFEAAPPMAVVLGKFLETNNKSAQRMGEALTRIGEAIEREMLSRQTADIFGDEALNNLAPIIEQVDAYMTEKYGARATIGSADLFDQPAVEPEPAAKEEPEKKAEEAKPDEKAAIEAETKTEEAGAEETFDIALVNIESGDVKKGSYTGETRYKAVGKAFLDLTGKKQADVLDEWKVLDATRAVEKAKGAEKKKVIVKPEPKKQLADILNKAIKTFAMEEAGQAILDSMDEAGVSPKEASDIFWEKVYPVLNEKTQKKFQQMLDGLGWEPGMAARKDAEGKVLKLKDWSDVAEFFSEDLPPTAENLEGTERGYVALMVWANGQYEKGKHEGAKEIHAEQIEQAEKETDTDPSDAQIEAENYKTGKVSMHGLKISIENPKGSTRSGTDKDGNKWSIRMKHSYGRILGTVGKDKDHIDIFLGKDAGDINMPVFVIDQVLGGTKQFDEHKVMMGFADEDAARAGYLANYEDGWQGLGEITQMTMDQFKHWLDTANHNRKAAMTFKPQASMIAKPKAAQEELKKAIVDKPDDAFDFVPTEKVSAKSIPVQHLQSHINSITSKWKLAHPQLRVTPQIIVVPKTNDLPESTLKKILSIQEKTGKRPRPRGAFKRQTKEIFLVAENIKSLAEAERILFHELLGHYGILITFGKQAAAFLNHAYMVFGKKHLNDIITRYGLDVKTLKGRQDAAEEGLAKLAEVVNEASTEQRLKNLWAKFLAKIDAWLRNLGFRSKMSKAELRVTMMKVSRNVRFGLDVVSSKTAEQIALSTESTDPLAEAFDLKGAIEDDKKTTRTFWQMLQKGQLIDRLFRLPFKFIGQVNEHGAWEITPKQKVVAKRAVELSKQIAKTSFRWLEPMLGAARTNIIEQYKLDELATRLTRQMLYGFVDKYGQTKEYKQRARQTKAEVREILMERDDILKTLASKGYGIEEAKLLQKALTGEPIDDADVTGVAAPIINAIDEMGGELVLLGMLDKAAYEKNRRIYLHRSYQKYEIEGGLAGWVSKFLKSRRQRIVGDQFKRRGIHKKVMLKDLRRSILADWWGKQEKGEDTNLYNREFIILDRMSYTTNATTDMLPEAESKRPRMLERVFWPADEAIPQKFNGWENRGTFEVTDVRKGVATLSRDYTREERDRMGEILDARYNIAKTYSMVAHDLASGRFFRDIARNEDWAIKAPPKDGTWTSAVPGKRKVYSDYDWVHVPETKVPGTSVKRYGDLAGMYVRSEIWIDLNEQEMMANPGTWTKVLRQWKLNKTARSPVVHMNNIVSNLLFMDMADIRMRDLIVGIESYVNKDAHYLDAVKHGAFSSGFIQQEIDSEVLRPLLKEIIQANLNMEGGTETRLTLVGKLMNGIYNLDKAMTRAYQMEDEIFRMATYMRRLTYGDTPEEAAALANYQFLDYNISAPYINAMKNTVFPFIAYSYRAIPVIASSLAQRPWKLAKYTTLAYVANALAYMITDDDEEDEQRRMMREEVSGYTWVGSPRLMRMPWNDEYDNPVFLDVRRWIPAGDVFDLNQGQSGFMPAWLQLSGPLSIGFEVFLNKQSFTGEEITNRLIDTPAEQTGAIANFLWKSSLPSAPWIPGSWYFEKIKKAATEGAVDSLGRDYSVPMALASSMGIKLQSVDPNMQKSQQARQFERVERALIWERKMLEYQYANKHINGDEYLRRKKILEDKLKLLGEKAKYVFTGEEGNQD